MRAIPIEVGEKYGRLTVLEYSPKSGDKAARIRCQCQCGAETQVSPRLLKNGNTQSCGCLRAEMASTLAVRTMATHGLSKHPLYQTWNSMLKRCYQPGVRNYADYGGRGIEVCQRWRGPDGVQNFISDMGPKPTPGHTLERKDNDGHYEPGNCCWATDEEQQRNRRPLATHAQLAVLRAENRRLKQRVAELEAALAQTGGGRNA